VRGRSAGTADVGLRVRALLGEPLPGVEVDRGVAQRVGMAARQLSGQLDDVTTSTAAAAAESLCNLTDVPESELVGVLLTMAYPERIAQKRDRSNSTAGFLLASGRGARLPGKTDPLAKEPYLAIAQLGGDTSDGRNQDIYLAARISKATITAHFPHLIKQGKTVFWNPTKKAVMARQRSSVGDIVLEEVPTECSDKEALPVLLQGIRQTGLRILPWGKGTQAWRERVQWVRSREERAAGKSSLPDLGDAALLGGLEEWLAPFLAGVRTQGQLQALDVDSAVRCLLSWDQQQHVEAMAPPRLSMPAGTSRAVDYSAEEPTVKVQIQEVFGLEQSPAVAGGSVPVLLHLLSPAQRPIQVTRDLAGFWSAQYAIVAKELRGRYPKHMWPEDPAAAQATTKTKKEMDRDAKQRQ